MEGTQYLLNFVLFYAREFVFDPDTLEDEVQDLFYDFDVKEIQLYDNQEGYWRDPELVESI